MSKPPDRHEIVPFRIPTTSQQAEAFENWLDTAAANGYELVAALPLPTGGRAAGVFRLGRRPELADTRSLVTGIVTAWPATASVRLPPLTDIVEANDTGWIGSGGPQGECRVHPIRQHPLAAPQRQRIH
jgi:hypothetical protein